MFLSVHVFVLPDLGVFGLSSVDRMAWAWQKLCSDWFLVDTVIICEIKLLFKLHLFYVFSVGSAVSAVKFLCGWCCSFFFVVTFELFVCISHTHS